MRASTGATHTRVATTNCYGLTQRLEHLSREVTKSASCDGDLHASRLRLDLHARQSISIETNLPPPPLSDLAGSINKKALSSRRDSEGNESFLIISFSSFIPFLLLPRVSRFGSPIAAVRLYNVTGINNTPSRSNPRGMHNARTNVEECNVHYVRYIDIRA